MLLNFPLNTLCIISINSSYVMSSLNSGNIRMSSPSCAFIINFPLESMVKKERAAALLSFCVLITQQIRLRVFKSRGQRMTCFILISAYCLHRLQELRGKGTGSTSRPANMAALGRALIARIESSIIPSMPTKLRELWFHDAGEWNFSKKIESHHEYSATPSNL